MVFPTHVGVNRGNPKHNLFHVPVFPTHVGVDRPGALTLRRKSGVFPTHVGVDRSADYSGGDGCMFSPHTWGWTVVIRRKSHQPRFSPHTWGWTATPHAVDRLQFSPHTWGWTVVF